MKVLLISPETPLFPAGGIATYIDHAIRAHVALGDEVFLLTWSYNLSKPTKYKHLSKDHCEIVRIDSQEIWDARPSGPYDLALSEALTPHILEIINRFGPEVVESTDYLAPLHHFLMLKRAGLLDEKVARIPVVVYNHGLQWEVYRAGAAIPAANRQAELAAERDVLRWSDVVLVPSRSALACIQRQICDPVAAAIVPEPFFWDADLTSGEGLDRFASLGRVSFAKGVDHCIHFLNIARTLQPIDEIAFVGSLPSTTFRETSVEKYILRRLHPDLHSKVIFHGGMARDAAIRTCGKGGGFSLNFSASETFNYAFLELLSAGLTPYLMSKTAMAEFVPANLGDVLLPQNFIDRDVKPIIERTRRDRAAIWEQIKQHAEDLTSPELFIRNYRDAVRPHMMKKIRSGVRLTADGTDVSILMASHNEVHLIDDAVRSARNQTIAPAEIIILDDGSTHEAALTKLEQLSKLNTVRVVKSSANEGLCASRVKLLDLCRTKFAVFLDADDMIDGSFIEKTLRAYNYSPLVPNAVVSWRQNFGASNEQVFRCNWDDHSHFLANELRMTGLVEIDALRSVGFRSSMRNGEADDWDFWLRFKQNGYRLVCIPEPLFRYRFAPGTMSWPWSEGQAALTAELIGKQLFQAIQAGRVSPAILVDLVAKATWQTATQQMCGTEPVVLSARRIDYVNKIRSSHPGTYTILQSIMRMATSVAKRQLAKKMRLNSVGVEPN